MKLENEVKGLNTLKLIAVAEIANLLPQLNTFVGKKLFTLTGFVKAFNPVFINDRDKNHSETDGEFLKVHRTYLTTKYGKLVLSLAICLNGGSYPNNTAYCEYFDRDYIIGDVENATILTSLLNLNVIKDDYELNDFINIDVEKNKIKEYKALKDAMESAKREIKVSESVYKYM